MPTLSNIDRALYALGYVKREFAFAGLDDVHTTVTLDDGSTETIDVLEALANAVIKMQLYESKENTKEQQRSIKDD